MKRENIKVTPYVTRKRDWLKTLWVIGGFTFCYWLFVTVFMIFFTYPIYSNPSNDAGILWLVLFVFGNIYGFMLCDLIRDTKETAYKEVLKHDWEYVKRKR